MVEIDYEEQPGLTRAERLQRMNQAFHDALNQYDGCQQDPASQDMSGAAQGGQGAGQDAGQGAGQDAGQAASQDASQADGQEETAPGTAPQGAEMAEMQAASEESMAEAQYVDSVPASDVQGSEPQEMSQEMSMAASGDDPQDMSKAGANPSDPSEPGQPSTVSALDQRHQNQRAASGGQGSAPGDIPSVDNDDAIAAQIRRAAEAERDPEKSRKLWNEYRKYKGMPQK